MGLLFGIIFAIILGALSIKNSFLNSERNLLSVKNFNDRLSGITAIERSLSQQNCEQPLVNETQQSSQFQTANTLNQQSDKD